MMLQQERDFTVKLEAKVGRLFASTRWLAEYGRYQASGKNIAEAKEGLATELEEALSRPVEPPAFWHDDLGNTWVAVPNGYGGSHVYMLTDDGAKIIEYFNGKPEDAFANSVSMTRIPNA